MAQAKFDIKTEATRPLYAGVGATDLAVQVARQYVADVQARVNEVQKKVADYEPRTLNTQAQKVARERQARLEKRLAELQAELRDAQNRLEKRLAELQADAKAFPGRAQAFVNEYVADVTDTYTDLVKRGEKAVARLRKLEVKVDVDSKATKTTVTTEAKSSAGTTKTAAKSTTKSTTRKKPAAKKAPARKTGTSKPATKKAAS